MSDTTSTDRPDLGPNEGMVDEMFRLFQDDPEAVPESWREFFACCNAQAVWPGGVLVELTGDNVTECLGGGDEVRGEDLESRYETRCDPRLNARQGLDLAFRLADLVRR